VNAKEPAFFLRAYFGWDLKHRWRHVPRGQTQVELTGIAIRDESDLEGNTILWGSISDPSRSDHDQERV
jgi:hypothetical protein